MVVADALLDFMDEGEQQVGGQPQEEDMNLANMQLLWNFQSIMTTCMSISFFDFLLLQLTTSQRVGSLWLLKVVAYDVEVYPIRIAVITVSLLEIPIYIEIDTDYPVQPGWDQSFRAQYCLSGG